MHTANNKRFMMMTDDEDNDKPLTYDTDGVDPVSQLGHKPIQNRLSSAKTPFKVNNECGVIDCQKPNSSSVELGQ